MPSSVKECSSHLNLLLNTVNASINTFTILSRPVGKWDDIFVYFILSKLSDNTRMDWSREAEREAYDFPSYEKLKKFLEDRIRTLDVVTRDTLLDSAQSEEN